MEQKRALYGDWMGCFYWLGGERTEWTLSLLLDSTYRLTKTSGDQPSSHQSGRFVYDEADDVIEFLPDDGELSIQYSIRDITHLERANTLLILRWVALASRNLPIVMYRVYHDPHGLQTGEAQ